MTWTAPRDWTTGEVVTETMMDTHVRDNLKYLKGQAGTVDIEASMTIAGNLAITSAAAKHVTMEQSGQLVKSFLYQINGLGIWDGNRDPISTTFGDTAKSHARITMDCNSAASVITFRTTNAANTVAGESARITGDGNLGVGTQSPQGRVHAYGAISGWVLYEFDALDGTARTIIPDGTGDILFGATIWTLVRSSGGTVQALHSGGTAFTPSSGAQSIYNAGADNVNITFNANGSVTVARSSGTLTYKVAIIIRWL